MPAVIPAEACYLGWKLDMGKGCVRFKSLEDLALDARFAGRELYGGRPRALASWSREAGAAVLVKTGRPHRPLAKSSVRSCACPRREHGQLSGGEGAFGEPLKYWGQRSIDLIGQWAWGQNPRKPT